MAVAITGSPPMHHGAADQLRSVLPDLSQSDLEVAEVRGPDGGEVEFQLRCERLERFQSGLTDQPMAMGRVAVPFGPSDEVLVPGGEGHLDHRPLAMDSLIDQRENRSHRHGDRRYRVERPVPDSGGQNA